MLTPTGFRSWADYFNFALAREYVKADDGTSHEYTKNDFERWGHRASRFILGPLNLVAKEISNPLMVIALTIMAVVLITIAFYPAQFMAIVSTVLPFVTKIQPWMIKFGLFLIVEMTAASVGMRAYGRTNTHDLLTAWQNKEILPLHFGVFRRSEAMNLC